jgi:hypothetical protein
MARILPALRLRHVAALAAFMCLPLGLGATAAPDADADAAGIEACLVEPAMAGRDLRECGERLFRQCLADAGDAGRQAKDAIACETRRGNAWALIARKAYRDMEARLNDAERRLLRTSQVQFELELKDLCAAARGLAKGDADLAAAACTSDLIAARAISLTRLATGRGASTP